MRDPNPKPRRPRFTQGETVHYTEEEGRRLYEESLRHDNGTVMVVQNALDTIRDGAHKGRNLLDVVVQLIGHMTPEQKRGLAERMPALLTDAAPPPTNGVPHSEAG
jgi:hypothetical protein